MNNITTNSSFEQCLQEAKKAFEAIQRTPYERQKQYRPRKRVVEIGYIDGIKKVEIVR